jgi:TRAP-type mannitol/chloroaromatic compound transport system permease large subunit
MVYNAPQAAAAVDTQQPSGPAAEQLSPPAEETLQELGDPADEPQESESKELAVGGPEASSPEQRGKAPAYFLEWFIAFAVLAALVLAMYYRRMDGEQLEILKLLEVAVIPLAVLTFIVLAVILFGITTATESAGIGALGALYLAAFAKYPRRALWSSLVGGVACLALAWTIGHKAMTLAVSGTLGALFAGTAVPWIWDLATTKLLSRNIIESTFLTAKTTAMVCWLFVGSAIFSAVFALHGGQSLIERWVLSMELTPLQFMLLAQAIIFLLGWPLEWTEIIVIFVPIFIPLLAHFHVDPVLFGTMVAVNLQAAFLSPPVAMSAFYLKGVAPPHVTLNQIFAGMMPYMAIVIVCLVFMYLWPGMTLWLPNFLYGR